MISRKADRTHGGTVNVLFRDVGERGNVNQLSETRDPGGGTYPNLTPDAAMRILCPEDRNVGQATRGRPVPLA